MCSDWIFSCIKGLQIIWSFHKKDLCKHWCHFLRNTLYFKNTSFKGRDLIWRSIPWPQSLHSWTYLTLSINWYVINRRKLESRERRRKSNVKETLVLFQKAKIKVVGESHIWRSIKRIRINGSSKSSENIKKF